MRAINSSALALINRVLGLGGGSASSGAVELEDSTVSQVLDIGSIVRRSLSLAGTEGIVGCVFQHTHGAGVSNQQSGINPYVPGALAHPPYPSPVPSQFDFWVIGAQCALVSGTPTNFTNGTLTIVYPGATQAISTDQAGAQLPVAGMTIPVGLWDTINGGAVTGGQRENGEMWLPINQRLRRNSTMQFDSTASNAVVVKMFVVCSLVPLAVGQDVAF